MRLVKKSEAQGVKNSSYCTALEYALGDKDLNGAVIILDGRYPEKGFALNLKCKEMAYIIEGKGVLGMPDREYKIAEGDLLLIEPNEKYYWEGKLKMFVPSTPAWYPEQHKQVK